MKDLMQDFDIFKDLPKRLPIGITIPLAVFIASFWSFAYLYTAVNPTIPQGENFTNVEVLLTIYPFLLLLPVMTVCVFLLIYVSIYLVHREIKKIKKEENDSHSS